MEGFTLHWADYLAFFGYFGCLSLIGWWAGRKKGKDSADYFLGGRSLPWYVVGSSYIAANISAEQFIGMIGSAYIYGICVATPEWSSVIAFTFLIWVFIPFLMSAKVFTTPEFLERRFNRAIRDMFAVITIIINVAVILGGVLYAGGLALQTLFGLDKLAFLQSIQASTGLDPIWFSIVLLTVIAGAWALYGGLKSIAWMDLLTIVIMVAGGLSVTILGWKLLGGDTGSIVAGFKTMIEANQADTGEWLSGMTKQIPNMLFGGEDGADYNRLSVLQPINHKFFPWLHWAFSFFYIGLWYMVVNQFMIQRIFGAKNTYHAKMGIVLASYMKLLMPFIVAVPGLIWFAYRPEIMQLPWAEVQPAADKSYVHLLKLVVPIGVRGIFLAALFGAIQSTISAVLNSTSTVYTMDIYNRMIKKNASENQLVSVGRWSSAVFIVLSILLGYWISTQKTSLFYYIQMAYSFFGPPFSAIFLLGSLWRRINGKGALASVLIGFAWALGLKIYVATAAHPWDYATTFPIQALSTCIVSIVACIVFSLWTEKPRPEQITDDLTFNWKRMRLTEDLGGVWYKNVAFWWGLSVVLMVGFIIIFGVIYK